MLPSLYSFYSELVADARIARDKVEEELDALLGTKEIYYRENPPEEMKCTEGLIKALLAKDEELRGQKELLISCKARVYRLESVLRSLEHKKNALDNLTVLWSKGYYSLADGEKVWNGNDEAQLAARKNLNK